MIERDRAKAGIVYVRRKRRGHRQRTERSRDKAPLAGRVRDRVRGMTSHARGREVYLLRKCPEIRVVHHALKKSGIFPSVFRFALKEEIVQPDGGGAEGVRLDDVRARLEIARVNLVDDLWPRQKEKFDAPLQILAFPILEARASVVGFGQLVLLNHGAHRAIEHDDALAHQRFERMEDFGGHVERELNRSSRAQQGTN